MQKNKLSAKLTRLIAVIAIIITVTASVLPIYAASVSITPELTGNATDILYEDKERRDEFSRHYVTGDGSYLAVSYSEQVNYQTESGEWIAVDNSLSENVLSGEKSTANEEFKLKFSKYANANKLVSIKTDEYKLSWSLEFSYDGESYTSPEKTESVGSKKASFPKTTQDAQSSGNAVSAVEYGGILPSVDLKYTVFHNKVKEDITLNENTGLRSYTVEYTVENGITAEKGEDGSVSFKDRDGYTLYKVSAPFMYDAMGEKCYNIGVAVSQSKKKVTVEYSLDTEWLSDEARLYPVVIDPELTSSKSSTNIKTAYFNEGDYESDGQLTTPNNYNSDRVWVDENRNIAYIEIIDAPTMPAFSVVQGVDLVLHAEADTFKVYYDSPILERYVSAKKVIETWSETIGYTVDGIKYGLPELSSDPNDISSVFWGNIVTSSDPIQIRFSLPVNNDNYESYFNTYRGHRILASYLGMYIIGSGEYAPAISVRYAYGVDAASNGITPNSTYTLKNSASNKYLTVSDYSDTSNNVFQDITLVNDQYSRGVKITYNTTTNLYRLIPSISDIGINQYIYPDTSGNIVYGTGVTATTHSNWYIQSAEGGIFIIKEENGSLKALTANGTVSGSSSETGMTDDGNIVLSDYTGNSDQIWSLTSIAINPHRINRSVTKKNVGAGAEWVFKLSDSEMNNSRFTVGTYSLSREGFATVIQNGKSLIVKVLPQDNTPEDRTDDYVVLTLPVHEVLSEGGTETQNRIVVIQSVGTGNGDACTTLPFEAETTIRTVTINEGETQNCMLTFKSDLGNVQIASWEIEYSTSGIDFDTVSGRTIVGANFAILRITQAGFAVVKAIASYNTAYTMIIECKSSANTSEYVKTLTTDDAASAIHVLTLQSDSMYLLNFNFKWDRFISGAGFSTPWDNVAEIVYFDKYYCVIKTYEILTYVDLDLELSYYKDDNSITVAGMCDYLVNIVDSGKEKRFEGIYYIRNRDSELYLEIDSNNSQMSDGAFMELHDFDGGGYQRWRIEYLDNGYYSIISVLSGLALMVSYDRETTENLVIRQGTRNLESPNQQWKIERTSHGSYKITNRASEEADTQLVLSMGDTLGDLDIEGTNVENRVYIDNESYKDEWEIVRKRGYRVYNYIDKGFLSERGYSNLDEAIGDIERAYSVVSYVLSEVYQIELIRYYSDADECSKIDAEGHVCSEGCNNSDYHSSDEIRDYFREQVGDDADDNKTSTYALWSNYIIRLGDEKNRSFSNSDSIFMLNMPLQATETLKMKNWIDIAETLLHELSHQFGAPDHYCETDNPDSNPPECDHAQYCENPNHYHESKSACPDWCIMDNLDENGGWRGVGIMINIWSDLISRSFDEIYCFECHSRIIYHFWS